MKYVLKIPADWIMNNYHGLLVVAIFVLLIGCTNTQTEYYENGQLKSEMLLKQGHYNGVCIWYYENGEKQQEVNYINDTLQGKSTRWYSNGQLRSVQFYKNNLLDGKVKNYTTNGKISREENYHLDTLNGKSIDFYPSGKTRIEGQYYNGLYDGKWLYYDEKGTMIGLGEFERGNGRQRAWYSDGILKRDVNYQDNEKHGSEKWYLPDGSPEKTFIYDHGRLVSTKTI